MQVTGPIPGQPALITTFFDLGAAGYRCEEYVLAGSATAFVLDGEAGDDGHWTALPGPSAPFRTRLVVYRPITADAFNGTVLTEWLNVSSGADVAAEWLCTHRELIRSGYAWVGVSAQQVGVEGGSTIFARLSDEDWAPALPSLKASDPQRYGSLDHPGDAYSFDIFTQAGLAVPAVLADLHADHILGAGQSQSASFLVTYLNAVAPLAPSPYDGFLIHGRSGNPPSLEGSLPQVRNGRVRVRTDGVQPVIIVQSETDVVGLLQSIGSRQPDDERLRLWEIAGAAHADTYTVSAAFTDDGTRSADELAALLAARADPFGTTFPAPINSGPHQHYVMQAALAGLDTWVRTGTAPARTAPLSTDGRESPGLVTDSEGIALGGVRTPWVDTPVAVLSGLGQEGGPVAAGLFGSTRPLPPGRLGELYPGGRSDYLRAFGSYAAEAVAAGFLLAEDLDEILALAAATFAVA